ncbi:MAG: DUF924 domain-containing protein [Alcanivoracaceae bacterium]|nr:DUF924 domain-containing protein [Alcanivoracaceae bacterium]
MKTKYQEIIKFWFEEINKSQWWHKDDGFDQLILERFSAIHTMASKCELFEWRQNADGRLAEIIILDQFSRNMFRNSPQAFAQDSLALALSQQAIAAGIDNLLDGDKRSFLYMPFMHSESSKIHKVALELFEKNDNQSSINFEKKHKDIIDRFGRYPHRNQILARHSTEEEKDFLKQPGSAF